MGRYSNDEWWSEFEYYDNNEGAMPDGFLFIVWRMLACAARHSDSAHGGLHYRISWARASLKITSATKLARVNRRRWVVSRCNSVTGFESTGKSPSSGRRACSNSYNEGTVRHAIGHSGPKRTGCSQWVPCCNTSRKSQSRHCSECQRWIKRQR